MSQFINQTEMLQKRNPNLPPTKSNSNKPKTKSKKYEIYSNATETKNAIPLMKNRKDVEFRLSRDSKSSQIHDFSDDFQAKLISWTSIPTTDMFCLRSMLKVKAGEITYKECNKEIREFEKFCNLKFGLIPDSPFMRNKEKFAWIGGGVDPKLKENPITSEIQEILEEETKFFEDSVNKLIEETESSDMIVKVFVCDTCESGTSYCAEVLDSQKGTWTCNFCLCENDTKRNQFYIYNKFALSIFTHLKATEELTFVQDPYIPTALLKLKGKNVAYSSTFLHKEKSPDTIERTIFNSPFMSNMKYHYPDKFDFSRTISNFYPSGTDTIEILNVFIGCEIIDLTPSKSFYLFYAGFADFDNRKDRNCVFRLMIIPRSERKDPNLEELLAVINDDFKSLYDEGLVFSSRASLTFTINVINYTGSERAIAELRRKTQNELELLEPCNPEQMTITSFEVIGLGYTVAGLISIAISILDPHPPLKEELINEFNRECKIRGKDFSFGDVFLKEMVDIHEAVCFLRAAAKSNKLSVISPNFKKCIDLFTDCSMVFIDQKANVGELLNLKQKIQSFMKLYELLSQDKPHLLTSEVKRMVELPDLFNYFGPNSLLTHILSKEEMNSIVKSFNVRKNKNILNSINKQCVLFHNYMNLLDKWFDRQNFGTYPQDLSERFLKYHKKWLIEMSQINTDQ